MNRAVADAPLKLEDLGWAGRWAASHLTTAAVAAELRAARSGARRFISDHCALHYRQSLLARLAEQVGAVALLRVRFAVDEFRRVRSVSHLRNLRACGVCREAVVVRGGGMGGGDAAHAGAGGGVSRPRGAVGTSSSAGRALGASPAALLRGRTPSSQILTAPRAVTARQATFAKPCHLLARHHSESMSSHLPEPQGAFVLPVTDTVKVGLWVWALGWVGTGRRAVGRGRLTAAQLRAGGGAEAGAGKGGGGGGGGGGSRSVRTVLGVRTGTAARAAPR